MSADLVAEPRPPALLDDLPLSALVFSVALVLGGLAAGGSGGWFLTLPLVSLYAHLWPRRALLLPPAGLALSAALYGLARWFGAQETPLWPTALIYLALAYGAVWSLLPLVRLRGELHANLERASADQRRLEVMAELAQLSARTDLNLNQAAWLATELLRPTLTLGAAALYVSAPGQPPSLEPVFARPGRAFPDAHPQPDSEFGQAHGLQTPTFVNLAAAAKTWRGGPHAPPSAYAALPLHLEGERQVSLIVLGGATLARWGVQDRQLLLAATRAVRLATERQQHLSSLDTLANHDALTGCLNRHAFARTLEGLDQAPQARGYCVALMDLDGFKGVNDRAGHARGDEILQLFAAAVRQTFFARDSLFRLGGDEFALILRDVPISDQSTLIHKINLIPGHLPGLEHEGIGVSVGVAHAREAQEAREVLALADARMYAAKGLKKQPAREPGAAPLALPGGAARDEALHLLSLATEARDAETHRHSERVTRWAVALGQRLGLSRAELQALRYGAFLHDIGKLLVPDRVLLKAGALSEDEWALMKSHAAAGHQLAQRLPFLDTASLAVIRSHHERWDGGGYPDGLKGEAIPHLARIFAVVDVFEALTSSRPYREAWPVARALDELRAQSGRHFDPGVVRAFLEVPALYGPWPAGGEPHPGAAPPRGAVGAPAPARPPSPGPA